MVARTLPGKQFEVGRQLRILVIRALARVGIVTSADATVGVVDDAAVSDAEVVDAQETAEGAVQQR
jgi:small conductance mechanosensitive channel